MHRNSWFRSWSCDIEWNRLILIIDEHQRRSCNICWHFIKHQSVNWVRSKIQEFSAVYIGSSRQSAPDWGLFYRTLTDRTREQNLYWNDGWEGNTESLLKILLDWASNLVTHNHLGKSFIQINLRWTLIKFTCKGNVERLNWKVRARSYLLMNDSAFNWFALLRSW